MFGSECDLKIHIQNLGYPLLLKIGAQTHLLSTFFYDFARTSAQVSLQARPARNYFGLPSFRPRRSPAQPYILNVTNGHRLQRHRRTLLLWLSEKLISKHLYSLTSTYFCLPQSILLFSTLSIHQDLPPGLRRPGLSFDYFRRSLKTHLFGT